MSLVISDLLYSDNYDFVVHPQGDMQHLMDSFLTLCNTTSQTISLKKILHNVLSPTLSQAFGMYGQKLEVVEKLVSLGSMKMTLYDQIP